MRLLRDLAHVAHCTRSGEFSRGRVSIEGSRRLDAVDCEKSDQDQQRKCDWPIETGRVARLVGQMRISFAMAVAIYTRMRSRETLFAWRVRVVIINALEQKPPRTILKMS